MKLKEKNFTNVTFCNRSINLYKNKEDIKTKMDVKIMELSGKGFYCTTSSLMLKAVLTFSLIKASGIKNS